MSNFKRIENVPDSIEVEVAGVKLRTMITDIQFREANFPESPNLLATASVEINRATYINGSVMKSDNEGETFFSWPRTRRMERDKETGRFVVPEKPRNELTNADFRSIAGAVFGPPRDYFNVSIHNAFVDFLEGKEEMAVILTDDEISGDDKELAHDPGEDGEDTAQDTDPDGSGAPDTSTKEGKDEGSDEEVPGAKEVAEKATEASKKAEEDRKPTPQEP